MDFLEKLDFMMERYGLNKRTLSIKSNIPYTTIDNWYKRGYEGMKLSTLRTLSDYFNTILDYWVSDEVTDPNAWKANGFVVNTEEMGHIQKYRLLDFYGKEAVDGVLDVEWRRVQAEKKATAAPVAGAFPMPPREMSDAELHAELDRQLAEEKKQAENPSVYGHGKSGTVAG